MINRKHSLNKSAKILFVFTVLSVTTMTTGCGKPECDAECQLITTILQLRTFGIWDIGQYLTPCMKPAQYTLKPGDTIMYKLPLSSWGSYSQTAYEDIITAGCSEKNWKLSIIPQSATGEVTISNKSHIGMDDKCTETIFKKSVNPGETVSIEGPAGCIPGKGENVVMLYLSSKVNEDEFEIKFE